MSSRGPVNKALYPNSDKEWTNEDVLYLTDTIHDWKAGGLLDRQGGWGRLYKAVATHLKRSKSSITSKHMSLRKQGKVKV